MLSLTRMSGISERNGRIHFGVLNSLVLHHTDPRTQSAEAEKALKNEIENLVKLETWKMILGEDVPSEANFITGSFVITIKDVETENSIFKASLFAHGNREAEKIRQVHDSGTVRQGSVRLLIALASIIVFDV